MTKQWSLTGDGDSSHRLGLESRLESLFWDLRLPCDLLVMTWDLT